MATLSKKKRFSRKKKRNISNKKKKRSQRKLKVGGTPGSLESEEYNIIDIIRDKEKIKEYLEKKVIEPNELDVLKKDIQGLFTEEKTVQRTEQVKKIFEGKRQELVDRIFEKKDDLQTIIRHLTKELNENKYYLWNMCGNYLKFNKLLPVSSSNEIKEFNRGEAEEYFEEANEPNKKDTINFIFGENDKKVVSKEILRKQLLSRIMQDMFLKEELIDQKLKFFQKKVIKSDTNFLESDKRLFIEFYTNLKNNFQNNSRMSSWRCLDIANEKLMGLNPQYPLEPILPPIVLPPNAPHLSESKLP